MTQLTSEEYAQTKGCKCPHCGSNQLSGGPVDISPGRASQEIICHDCGAVWTDVYKLGGYEEIEEPS